MKLSRGEDRIAERLESLVEEGREIASLAKRSSHTPTPWIQGADKIQLRAWLGKVENIIERVFGRDSGYYRQYDGLTKGLTEKVHQIYRVIGLIEGALDDLRGGYLIDQELLIAGEVFDSIVEQARHLSERGYKDPAAVLARVVLEDGLRRISKQEGLDNTVKASKLNENLRDAGRYPKPRWRQIQAWLDLGNAAAHGDFDDYEHADVAELIDDVEGFLAAELS